MTRRLLFLLAGLETPEIPYARPIDASLKTAFGIEAWRAATKKNRLAAIAALADATSGTLELVRSDVGELGLPAFAHRASHLLFHLVPGGRFTMGMTDEELARLQTQYSFYNDADSADAHLGSTRLRPATSIDLDPFLLATQPLGGIQLEWLRAPAEERASLERGTGKRAWDYAKMAKLPAAKYIAYLEKSGAGEVENDDVEPIEAALHALGLRLPSEAEWERAARGGDGRSFSSGNIVPQSPSMGINPFGFVDLGATAEVCADGWLDDLAGIPTDGRARPPSTHRVVRGGAANVYPWQDCAEWTLLACAMRVSMEGEEGLLAIRPAMTL